MSDHDLDAKILPQNALPIIDVSGLRSGGVLDRHAVGRALLAACLDKGFFYMQGHAVPEHLSQSVFHQSEAFFALPEAEKNAIALSQSLCNRGYEPLRAQTLEIGQPPDLKEGFYSGREIPASDARVLAGKFNHGPNQWPATLPGFRPVMEEYHGVMVALGRLVMGGIALALDLQEDAFSGFCKDELATLRLLHYPPQPANPAPGEKGCGAHTDFGTLTFLAQDDCGGLQVWDEEAGWIHADPVADSYVVNLGDMMARWSNGRFRSTLHRVINTSGRQRYSVPFFYLGNPDYPIRCIDTCLADGMRPLYPDTTMEAHYQAMYRATYHDETITA
jgi:isopenicillin N synthase-like dioxygenase